MTVPGGMGTSAPLQDGESRAGIPPPARELPTATLTQCLCVLIHLLIPRMSAGVGCVMGEVSAQQGHSSPDSHPV